MIFGRKSRKDVQEAVETAAAPVEETVDEGAAGDVGELAPAELSEVEAKAREWDDAFDREEGPFDIHEVDLEAVEIAEVVQASKGCHSCRQEAVNLQI